MIDLAEQLDANQIFQRLALFLLESECLEDILWNIANDVVGNLGFEDCVVYLLENDDTLVQKAAHGPKNPDERVIKTPITIPVGEGIVGTVAKTGIPENVPNTKLDARYIVDDEIRLSELTVPIIYNGKVLGVLDSENTCENYFTEAHLEQFVTIASLAAPKIFHAIAKEQLTVLNKSLQDSTHRYKQLIEQCPDAIVVHKDQQIVYHNKAFVDLTLSPHGTSLVQKELTEFVSEEFHPQFMDSIENQSNLIRWYEIDVMTRYCTRINVETSSLPIPFRGSTATQTIFHDVTAFKRREADLAAAMKKAEDMNKAKSQFLSRISHELRTPLNAILGFAQLQQMKFADLPQEVQEGNQKILSAGAHLLALVNDVLDISQIEQKQLPIKLRDCPLFPALESSVALVKEEASKSDIHIVINSFDYEVIADPTRLKQVLLNLLSNAIKYNYPGGKVCIQAKRKQHDLIELRISDTGIGIARQDIDVIFEPFTRLKNAEEHSFNGAGIGLGLCKALLQEMNGSIRVTSEPGKGSCFIVNLPSSKLRIQTKSENQQSEAPNGFAKIKLSILYVEDDPSSTKLVQNILAMFPNISLQTAASGRAGLEAVNNADFDLIMLDMDLPDTNGIALLKSMQEYSRETQFLALSADAIPQQIDSAISAGFDFYLTKPLQLSELFSYLRMINKRTEHVG